MKELQWASKAVVELDMTTEHWWGEKPVAMTADSVVLWKDFQLVDEMDYC